MTLKSKNPGLFWLINALAINLLLAFVISALLFLNGEPVKSAVKATAPANIVQLRYGAGGDSWTPMFKAYRRKMDNPAKKMYDIFFTEGVKFQYPPSSLLIFDLFPSSMLKPANNDIAWPLLKVFGWLSRFMFLMTTLISFAVFEISLRKMNLNRTADKNAFAARLIFFSALAFTYYPMLIGHELGQIQVYLNALIALGILFKILNKDILSGACFGICCLVKPQYAVILFWAVLRKHWKIGLGVLSALLPGLLISIVRFGLQDHLQYLEVLKIISRQGESFWFNQSMNGLANRFLGNGSPFYLGHPTDFAPYHPAVYAMTVASSILIFAAAFWFKPNKPNEDQTVIDLFVVLAASTMASPVAWNHHYGIFLPMFAFSAPLLMQVRPFGRSTAFVLTTAYILMANAFLRPNLLFTNPWTGLMGSYLFFGALMFFGLLVVLRAACLSQKN